MKKYLLAFIFSTLVFGQNDFSLEDINPLSDTYEQLIGPSYFAENLVVLGFFHEYWGSCRARFGLLNDIYLDLISENIEDVKIIGVDAYGSILKKYHETGEIDPNEIYSYRIEGLGKNIVPSATDFKIIDKFVKVTDSDSAHMAREITLNEGLFVGYTSGAAFQAVKTLNDENEFNDSSCVVIVFPDHGSRYLSKIYSDEWMNNQGFYDSSFYQPKKNSINCI